MRVSILILSVVLLLCISTVAVSAINNCVCKCCTGEGCRLPETGSTFGSYDPECSDSPDCVNTCLADLPGPCAVLKDKSVLGAYSLVCSTNNAGSPDRPAFEGVHEPEKKLSGGIIAAIIFSVLIFVVAVGYVLYKWYKHDQFNQYTARMMSESVEQSDSLDMESSQAFNKR